MAGEQQVKIDHQAELEKIKKDAQEIVDSFSKSKQGKAFLRYINRLKKRSYK